TAAIPITAPAFELSHWIASPIMPAAGIILRNHERKYAFGAPSGSRLPTNVPARRLHQYSDFQPRRTLAQCVYQSLLNVCPRTEGLAPKRAIPDANVRDLSRNKQGQHFRAARFDFNQLIIIIDRNFELPQVVTA